MLFPLIIRLTDYAFMFRSMFVNSCKSRYTFVEYFYKEVLTHIFMNKKNVLLKDGNRNQMIFFYIV